MAEDLGDIASLLGSSFVQTAAMNEDEQNEYRKRAMRQQLLYAFAAPLAQQAGQQLGQGVIDLAGNLFLGDKSKNFFERQEGASLQKRLFDMSKQSEKFDETDKVYLKLGNGDIQEGIKNAYIEKKKRASAQFKNNPLYPTVEPYLGSLTKEEEADMKTEYEEYMKGRELSRLAARLDDKELQRRFKNTPEAKGQIARALRRLTAPLTGKSYDETILFPSMDRMLTGGDKTLRDTEFYRLAMDSDYFKENFEKIISAAKQIGPSNSDEILSNAFQILDNTLGNDGGEGTKIFQTLKESSRDQAERALESNSLKQKAASNSLVSSVLAELESKNIPVTKENLSAGILNTTKGVADVDNFVDFFRNDVANDDIITYLRDSLAQRSTYKRPFDQIKNTTAQNKIDVNVDKFLKQTLTRFNGELSIVISEEIDKGNFNIDESLITTSSMHNLAYRYLQESLNKNNGHLVNKMYEAPTQSVFDFATKGLQKVTGQPTGQAVATGQFANNDKLREFIRSSITSNDVVLKDEKNSKDSGLISKVKVEVPEDDVDLGVLKGFLEDLKNDLSKSEREKQEGFRSIFKQFDSRTLNPVDTDRISALRDQYLTPQTFIGRGRNRRRSVETSPFKGLYDD